MTKTITLARIKKYEPCPEQWAIVERDYPKGIPLTEEAALDIQAKGGDVMWGLVRLMTKAQRRAFILYTLRLRQPHIVTLFEKAKLNEHAKAIAALTFNTLKDAEAAIPILGGARDAARDAAWAAAWAAWAARDAAWAAAWAARDAARDAAWDAAWDAANKDTIRYAVRLLRGEA